MDEKGLFGVVSVVILDVFVAKRRKVMEQDIFYLLYTTTWCQVQTLYCCLPTALSFER